MLMVSSFYKSKVAGATGEIGQRERCDVREHCQVLVGVGVAVLEEM